jgi:alpha-galactosidase
MPLLRSDYIMEPVGNQCHTYALSSWFPFYGTGTSKTDPYLILSTLCPHFTACWDMREDALDYDRLSRIVAQWKMMAPFFMGDYYPLTGYTLSEDQWIAWQFHAPEEDSGMVQVFRRGDSIYESARMPLKGLIPEMNYSVKNVDEETSATVSGQELMEKGIPVSMPERPSAAILLYRRVE